MMLRSIKNLQCRRGRRGSALVLVVAVLAILAIFSLTLGYNSRVELMATRNWTNGIQARMAAATGVALASPGTIDKPLSLKASGVTLASVETQAFSAPGLSTLKPLTIAMHLDPNGAMAIGSDADSEAPSPATGPHNPWAVSKVRVVFPNAGQALAAEAVQDASAKININAILPKTEAAPAASPIENPAPAVATAAAGTAAAQQLPPQPYWSENALARFIDKTLQAKHVAGVNATLLARSIALRRYGSDKSPGTVGASPLSPLAVNSPDPRLAPAGDDRPYGSLTELMNVQGMTPEAYEALTPYLTVFSASFAAMDLTGTDTTIPAGQGFPQVDPNTASPEMIFDALRQRYPKAPDALLAQFAINVVDRRDADDTPTQWTMNGQTYYGLEENPCINEVCSDVPSAEGQPDHGQYIELSNPYHKSFSIDGWTIAGAGGTVLLHGSLPAGGFLVVTDSFNNPDADSSGDGLGSFYRIFGVVGTGDGKKIQEAPSLDLPDDAGEVRLLDAKGKMVDVFKYSGGRWNGATRSFQRNDPRIRSAALAPATPLAANQTIGATDDPTLAIQVQERWQNRPFASALDAMLVSSAYSSAAGGGKLGDSGENWALPVLLASSSDQLDSGLVDCFRVGATIPSDEPLDAFWRNQPAKKAATLAAMLAANSASAKNLQPMSAAARLQKAGASVPNRPACAVVFGNLNLNTASPATLSALPGMTESLLGQIIAARSQRMNAAELVSAAPIASNQPEWWTEQSPFKAPAWQNLSDVLQDETIWKGRALYERLDLMYTFSPLVSTHTMTVRTLTTNREAPPADKQEAARRATAFMDERIMTGDRGAIETVRFGFFGRGSASTGDPDLRYAKPLGTDAKLMEPQALIAAAKL